MYFLNCPYYNELCVVFNQRCGENVPGDSIDVEHGQEVIPSGEVL